MKSEESEKVVEAYLVKRMKAVGGKAYKWVSPGNVGVPDRLCVCPGGVIRLAELNGKGGRISPRQCHKFAELDSLGVPVSVLWSREDVDRFIGWGADAYAPPER